MSYRGGSSKGRVFKREAQTQADWLTGEVAIYVAEGWPCGCVLWPMSVDTRGYGQVRCTAYGRTVEKVHRLAWFLAYGTWPVHTLDHVKPRCTSTLCYNVTHLEDVTQSENIGRYLTARYAPCSD